MSRIDTTPNSCWTFHDYTQRNTLGRKPFIGREWNELPETIIEAANTEAFKLALRAQARPHWEFEHFLFLYLQHKFTALFFSTHSTSTAQSAEDGLHCPLQTRHLDLDVVQEDPNIFPFCKVFRPWFFKHWIMLSTGEITTQWKSPRETNCIIHWIENYPMDSVIHLLNNWGQAVNICNKFGNFWSMF